MTRWQLLTALAIVLLGLFLYGPTIDLLLFWDDVPHMQWLAAQNNGAYWFTAEGFPFYRPTAFTIWEIMHTLWGYHNPQALHALSILLHVANAWLVGVVISKLSTQPRSGLWAGLIFLAFPFSYQTVIPTPAHFHLWLVLGLLSAAWCLLRWHDTGRRSYLVYGWGLAFWAVFSHENGILAPLLLSAIMLSYRIPWRKLIVPLSPIALATGLYGVIWLIVPKANDATGLQLDAMEVKIGQTLQALGFPLAALFRQIFDPVSGTTLAWLSGGFVFISVVMWAIYQRQHLAIMALGWIPVVMAPAWLMLDVNYLLGSPRLHYLAAVGIAWALGVFLDQAWPHRPVVIGSLGVGVCMLVAVPFVRDRAAQHQTIDNIYRDVQAIADGLPANSRLLLINGPAYLAPKTPTFLLGAEGSTYLPDFVRLQDWLALNGTETIEAVNRRVEDIIPTFEEQLAITHPHLDRSTIHEYDFVATVMSHQGTLSALLTGAQTPLATDAPLGDFGNGVLLQDAIFDAENLRLDLTWQVTAQPEPAAAIFVHILCTGELVAQADGPPLGRVYPFVLWKPGEVWHDYRYFDSDQVNTCLTAFIGLWNPNDNARLTIVGTEADGLIISPQ